MESVHYLLVLTFIPILYVIQNIRNTFMKGLHSPCSWITSFHVFGFNIEVSLYHICMTFIWVLWWCGRNIWCMDLWYYFHILFNRNIINTSMKSLHTHALVSLVFMDFGFNLEVVLYQICMRYIIWVWGCCDRNIWCITMWFNFHILCGYKYRKLVWKFCIPMPFNH